MKMCNRCKVNVRYSQTNSRRSLCRSCMQDNQDQVRQKRALWIRSKKRKTGCVKCGYNEHHAALDFHHVRGEKRFTIGYSLFRGYAVIQSEMDKCEVLCSNCHRIVTYNNMLSKGLARP